VVDNLFSVTGRIVVVTGGLGQLGRQFARALAERGARVAVFDLPGDVSLRANSVWGQFAGDVIRYWSVDVTNRASIAAGLAGVMEAWGTPHGLINAAAVDSPPNAPAEENGPFETYPEASWDRIMEANVKGVFLCCQVIGGAMASSGRGSVINISSIYGQVSPDQRIYDYRRGEGQVFFKPVAYSASKSALFNLTRYLATYWADHNVRVNTLTLAGVFNQQDEQFLSRYLARLPVGRMAHEDEYNGAVLFLLSDAASYMTGSNLVMDGGWTAW
jgi:NAD(P)-dependent dehydrogenase (short-subunit alcohol dehydrogenase family)